FHPVIWFEVEDFLRYFDHFPNPTGVQRLSFEMYRAAYTLYGRSKRVRFCRLSIYSKRLHAGRLRRHPFRVLDPARPYRSLEDILGTGTLLERIPQIVSCVHAASGFFLFHLQGGGSRSHQRMATPEPV